MSTPGLVFGAGGLGTTEKGFIYTWSTPEAVSEVLVKLNDLGVNELDSAASYPPGNPWNTETVLGQAEAAKKGFIIDSKIAVHEGPTLNDQTISASLDKTLELLGTSKVRTLYSHVPDPKTPVEETAAAYHRQYEAGKFERLGLCNHSAAQVTKYLEVCEKKGFVKPSVVQGHYNALVRGAETDLLPLLRKHGISYFAYSPLGGGFLTGKVTFASSSEDPSLARTRWAGESVFPYYTELFDKPKVHEAIRRLHARCEAHGLSLAEVCLRWLMHHSALQKGDAIIIGATKISQLEGNVADCRKPPLPKDLVDAVEAMGREAQETQANWGGARGGKAGKPKSAL